MMSLNSTFAIASSGMAQNGCRKCVDMSPHEYARIAWGIGTLSALAAATTYGASTAHFDPPDGMKRLSTPEYQ